MGAQQGGVLAQVDGQHTLIMFATVAPDTTSKQAANRQTWPYPNNFTRFKASSITQVEIFQLKKEGNEIVEKLVQSL
jgi:hypothetical protein